MVLDRVGGAKTARARRRELQTIDGERLLLPFEQVGGGIRILGLQPLCLLFHSCRPFFDVKPVGGAHDHLGLCFHSLVGDTIVHVSQLVCAAARTGPIRLNNIAPSDKYAKTSQSRALNLRSLHRETEQRALLAA